MNRAAQIFGLFCAFILAPLFLNTWHAAARGPHQEPKDKSSPATANSSPQTTDKKLIVVLDFDDSAVGTDVLGDKVDVGKEIAGLLAQQLAKDGTYLVVDSKTLAADLAAHDFSKTDRYNFDFAVNLGKRLGAGGVIMGSVTLFGKERNARPIPQDEVIRRKIKARVAAEARIVDVSSGEIVAAADARGESKREGISLTSGGSNWHDFRSGNFGFASSEFQETILGEAVNDMVLQLTKALAAEAPRLTPGSSQIKPGDPVKSATH
jgi:curli biogenesis system outer membrane secretion channel CsgG